MGGEERKKKKKRCDRKVEGDRDTTAEGFVAMPPSLGLGRFEAWLFQLLQYYILIAARSDGVAKEVVWDDIAADIAAHIASACSVVMLRSCCRFGHCCGSVFHLVAADAVILDGHVVPQEESYQLLADGHQV